MLFCCDCVEVADLLVSLRAQDDADSKLLDKSDKKIKMSKVHIVVIVDLVRVLGKN